MTTATAAETPAAPPGALAEFARLPVFLLAGATALLLLVTSGRYGYFGDELYFLAASKHLAWGYADQPPILPLLAAAMDGIAPGSLPVFRLPATLATGAGVVFCALIARELGGKRTAQVMAAGAFAICGQFVGSGHYLATSTIDPMLWTVVLWVLVRWLRTRDDNLLLWLGVATAVTLNVKFLIGAFWAVAAVCLLLFGPHDLLRRPKLWVGAGIALLSCVPTLLWQAMNAWPQLGMGDAISKEVDGSGGRGGFLMAVLIGAGLVTGALGLLYGLWCLLFTADLRPYRFLGWTALGLTALFILVNGRFYYVSGMYPICWAAAAVAIERRRPALWWRWVPTWPVYVLSALYTLPYVVPIWPIHSVATNFALPRPAYAAEEIGWPQLADSVAQAYRGLPEDVRAHTTIITTGYWQAGALGRYGPDRGLPEAFSGSRGFWYFGSPPQDAETVLYLGYDPNRLASNFMDSRIIARVHNNLGILNSSENMPIWLISGRTEPWSVIWPQLRDLKA
ncbi:MAG: glycosyl transferase, family 39 [Amycolatopsis sp.]|uniref:ArnT family glycosyltransferase n=1 Tax=Amycolatopsis sp. TaxID=37632 RepID=UPI00262832EF|nr:glycosyltransferase family 39 protein [Amycolatopsis sp.]MCU1687059.1 glycosyl transferase, family 39 [Amycolatopsis sp.]